jgi:hypothetical protein
MVGPVASLPAAFGAGGAGGVGTTLWRSLAAGPRIPRYCRVGAVELLLAPEGLVRPTSRIPALSNSRSNRRIGFCSTMRLVPFVALFASVSVGCSRQLSSSASGSPATHESQLPVDRLGTSETDRSTAKPVSSGTTTADNTDPEGVDAYVDVPSDDRGAVTQTEVELLTDSAGIHLIEREYACPRYPEHLLSRVEH